jgi:hypothetical protein
MIGLTPLEAAVLQEHCCQGHKMRQLYERRLAMSLFSLARIQVRDFSRIFRLKGILRRRSEVKRETVALPQS